jgi:hypothetical protein
MAIQTPDKLTDTQQPPQPAIKPAATPASGAQSQIPAPMTPPTPTPLPAAGSNNAGTLAGASGGATGGLQPVQSMTPPAIAPTQTPTAAPAIQPAAAPPIAPAAPAMDPYGGTGSLSALAAAQAAGPKMPTPGLIQPTAEAAANGAYATQTSPVAQTANMGPEKFAAWESQFPGGKAPQWALSMLEANNEDQFGNGYGGGNKGGVGGQWSTDFATAPDWQKGAPPGGVPQAGSPLSLQEMQTALTADAAQNPSGVQSPGYTSSGSVSPTIQPANANPSAGIAPAGTPAGVGLNQIDPNADMRNTSVLPTDAVDRGKLVDDRFKNYLSGALPEFQRKLRGTFQDNAAMGRLGSGQLATSVGDLDLNAQREANQTYSDLTSNAAEGSIQDARNNRNEYRNERDYQGGLENQAYNRGIQGVTLEDALTNSAFGRSQAQNAAGQANSPTSTMELLSQIFGQQATGAGQAMAGLVSGNAKNNQVNQGTPNQGGGIADAASILTPEILAMIRRNNAGTQAQGPADEDYGVAP